MTDNTQSLLDRAAELIVNMLSGSVDYECIHKLLTEYETRSLYTEQPPVLSAELLEAIGYASDALEDYRPHKKDVTLIRAFLDATKGRDTRALGVIDQAK